MTYCTFKEISLLEKIKISDNCTNVNLYNYSLILRGNLFEKKNRYHDNYSAVSALIIRCCDLAAAADND